MGVRSCLADSLHADGGGCVVGVASGRICSKPSAVERLWRAAVIQRLLVVAFLRFQGSCMGVDRFDSPSCRCCLDAGSVLETISCFGHSFDPVSYLAPVCAFPERVDLGE